MNNQVREKVLGRVKRIAGQIAGVQRMIEQDRYCVDVLNQISAVRLDLDALGVELLTNLWKPASSNQTMIVAIRELKQ